MIRLTSWRAASCNWPACRHERRCYTDVGRHGSTSMNGSRAPTTLPECKKGLTRQRDPERQVDRRQEIRGPYGRPGGARCVEIVREVDGASPQECQPHETHRGGCDEPHRSPFGGQLAGSQENNRQEQRRH
jgi:hypothetical protein